MDIPLTIQERTRVLGIIESPGRLPVLSDADIRAALEHPVWPEGGGPTVFDLVKPGETVCLVVSDSTRRTGVDRILPVLLAGFTARGCSIRDLFILVASGIHRHPTGPEMRRILGEAVFTEFSDRIHYHDPDDPKQLVDVGRDARGRSVRINRRAMDADRLIPIGTATYHYHAGFGGGRKSLVPGLADRTTIAFNHSLALDPEQDRLHPCAAPGILDGNPVAEDMLADARLCAPDLIINSVLTPDGHMVGLFSGDLDLAHRRACALVERVSRVDLAEAADLVVAWAGEADTWIQAHKALFNADRAVREGGKIVLVAPCREGLGNERFRVWVRKRDPARICRELRSTFEVNGQTALSTCQRGRRAILVSELSSGDREDLGMAGADHIEGAVADALAALAGQGVTRPTCYLMPHAMHTLPFIGQSRFRGE